MKDSIFHCGRFPSLVLTVKPYGQKDPMGNVKPAKHLNFHLDPIMGPGILRVSDEDMVKFVKNHEYFKSGQIIEVEDVKDIPKVEKQEKVSTGVHDTREVRTPSGEPKEGSRPVKAVKTPGKK